jgi:hypothetical protein
MPDHLYLVTMVVCVKTRAVQVDIEVRTRSRLCGSARGRPPRGPWISMVHQTCICKIGIGVSFLSLSALDVERMPESNMLPCTKAK